MCSVCGNTGNNKYGCVCKPKLSFFIIRHQAVFLKDNTKADLLDKKVRKTLPKHFSINIHMCSKDFHTKCEYINRRYQNSDALSCKNIDRIDDTKW